MSSVTRNDPLSWGSLDIISNQVALEKFNRLYQQARLAQWVGRLVGRPQTLLSYEQVLPQTKVSSPQELGIQQIPIKSIVGSLGRDNDYDRQFRPLNLALRYRWINIHMLAERNGWKPIVVYKIADQYFVVDGHHRVSVARHSGWDTIEAHVSE